MIRGNLSSEANMMLGKIEGFYHTYCSGRVAVSLADMLRNMAAYLDKKTTDILHPEGAKSLVTAFKYKKKQDQLDILSGLRQSGRISRTEDVCLCKNSEERTKLYETAIKKEKY